jgi:hypothetical protein
MKLIDFIEESYHVFPGIFFAFSLCGFFSYVVSNHEATLLKR